MGAAAYLRRLIAAAGLLLLAPICWLLFSGRITPADAGLRAAVLFLSVVVLRRLSGTVRGPGILPPG
jgi:hypothetical protein